MQEEKEEIVKCPRDFSHAGGRRFASPWQERLLLQKAACFLALYVRSGGAGADAAQWREEIGSREVRSLTKLLREQEYFEYLEGLPTPLIAIAAYDFIGGEGQRWRTKARRPRRPILFHGKQGTASPAHILCMSRRMVAYWRAHPLWNSAIDFIQFSAARVAGG